MTEKQIVSFFFQAEDGIRDLYVTGVQTCALPILTPKTIPFWDAFVKRFQRNPVYTAGGAYDAIHLYAEAAARAKTIEAGPVIKELEKTDMVGTAGRIAFDDTHDLRYGPGYAQVMFVQWQEGGKRAIVWPKERADGK